MIRRERSRTGFRAATAALPLNVAALKERLDAGIPARTVLWLGELRQYADADGGPAVLGRLADLLDGEAAWLSRLCGTSSGPPIPPRPVLGPGAADPAGTIGRLLERLPGLTGRDLFRIDPAHGAVIDIPDRFTTGEMEAGAATGDPALGAAAAAAATARQSGQVTQYLAGVPDLLDRWLKPDGDPYGQAIITAAVDATRAGSQSPLPAGLVQDAAVGDPTAEKRTEDFATWRDTALAWATAELRGAVRALRPLPPPMGIGAWPAFRSLTTGRRTRQDQLGPLTPWEALAIRRQRQ